MDALQFLIVPFLVVFYGLPMYVVPAATIPYAVVLSAVGLFTYCVVLPLAGVAAIQPEWAWGFFAAAGGILGSWAGAKTQLYMPEHLLNAMLGIVTGGACVAIPPRTDDATITRFAPTGPSWER